MGALATFIFLTWLLSLPPCGPTAPSLTDTTPFLGFFPLYTNVCNAAIILLPTPDAEPIMMFR